LKAEPTVTQFDVGLPVGVALAAVCVRVFKPAVLALARPWQLVTAGLARPHPAPQGRRGCRIAGRGAGGGDAVRHSGRLLSRLRPLQ
jgi:hypothetical protein